MARKSITDRYQIFVAAAVLAAHAVRPRTGFRQLDVCRFVELFSNWLESMEPQSDFSVQHTQIARYLENLVREGFARRMAEKAHPLYRLTRSGLVDIATRVKNPAHLMRREYFFFVLCMARSYRRKMLDVFQREGSDFPKALQLEMESLFDTDHLLDMQIAAVNRELKKLDERLEMVQKSQALAGSLLQSGSRADQVLEEIDRLHPFGLDQQQRYSEVFSVATEKQAIWELTTGNQNRVKYMWLPARNMLAHYVAELRALKSAAAKE